MSNNENKQDKIIENMINNIIKIIKEVNSEELDSMAKKRKVANGIIDTLEKEISDEN